MAFAFEQIEEPYILGETDSYIAVFKPAGMHSVLAKAGGEEGDLLSWFARMMPEARQVFEPDGSEGKASELGMLSRLDRGTSGIILFARTPELRKALFALASNGGIRKEYKLFAAPSDRPLPGSLPGQKSMELPVGLSQSMVDSSDDSAWIRVKSFFRSYGVGGSMVACVDPDRAADCRKKLTKKTYSTMLKVVARNTDVAPGAVCMAARIGTGFRHQIRAHLAWSGFPILGDSDYGGRDARRLFLEAHRIDVDQAGDVGPATFELYGALQN